MISDEILYNNFVDLFDNYNYGVNDFFSNEELEKAY